MIFKGNFLYTPALGELTVREGEYLVVDGEKCAGFYQMCIRDRDDREASAGRNLIFHLF